MKYNHFLLLYYSGFIFIGFNCSSMDKRTKLTDVLCGNSRKWKISASFNSAFKLERKLQIDPCAWIYVANHENFEYRLRYSADVFYSISQLQFCQSELESRKFNLANNHLCSDSLRSEIVVVNSNYMILSELYCKKNLNLIYELYTLFDGIELTLNIGFYHSIKNNTDLEKYRKEMKLIYESIVIK